MIKILHLILRKPVFWLLFFMFPAISAWGQNVPVTGTVVDSVSHEPLPGVSIQVEGTSSGTVTDSDGKFTLSVPSATSVLVFTYIGYQRQRVPLAGRSNITVNLSSETKMIEEVVVTGYGPPVKRRDLTGSVSSVGEKQLKDVPITSAQDAIAGRLAGVEVTSSEGNPDADVRIVVRGGGSITQDNSPLYIVDGIQVNNALATLSPQDIQTIDVLKDASATAIYGARGANGVVIITTKGGREGKTTVNFNTSIGLRKLARELPVMNPYQFVMYQYERTRSSATDSTTFAQQYGPFDTLQVYRNTPMVDWQDKVFGRDAWTQNYNLSITGGSKETNYNLSLTRNDETGIMLSSSMLRNLVNFRLDHTANDKLKIGVSIRYIDQRVNGSGTSSSGTAVTNKLRNSVMYKPFSTGNGGSFTDVFDENYYQLTTLLNPVLDVQAEYRTVGTDQSNFGGYISYNIFKNLNFKSTAGFDVRNIKFQQFYSGETNYAIRNSAGLPAAITNTNTTGILNNSNVLTYTLSNYRNHHNLTVMAGQEIYQETYKALNVESRYLPSDITAEKAFAEMNLGNPPSGAVQPRPTSDKRLSRLFSLFSRVNYSYDDKYLLTLSLRADQSSKFLYKNSMGYFPSAAFAWRISKEKFMPDISQISDLKLRASYGAAGNNRIGDFLYTSTFNATSEYGLGKIVVPALAPTSLPNPDLKWETTIARNIGMDLALFNNRVQMSADYYNNSTKDLLIDIAIPNTSGYTTQIRNVGKTSNRGVELQLNANIINTRNFSWTANFNITFNRTRVDDLGGLPFRTYNSGWGGTDMPLDDYIVKVGEPLGLMYGFRSDGFYKVEDFNYNPDTKTYTLKPGVPYYPDFGPVQPGNMKFKRYGNATDANGNPIITSDDRQIIGNANPKHFGGLNQQFTLGNWDMSIFLNWKYGNQVYNANKIEFTSGYYRDVNMLTIMNDRWRTVNDQGQVVTDPAELASLNQNAKIWQPNRMRNYFTDWAVEDGSFLRINNVTIGYTLPKSLLSRFKVVGLRAYFTVNNLATITKYSGYDPEVSTRRNTPLTPGVDYSAFPRSRYYLLGLNLTL